MNNVLATQTVCRLFAFLCGRHQPEEPRREPAFRRIVHRVHDLADIGSRKSRTHDTDARLNQEMGGPRQKISINPSPQPFGLLSCEDRGALDGHTACQQDQIADGDASLPHEASPADLAEHVTDQNRAVEALGDFRVPAAERVVSASSGVVRLSGRSMTTKTHNGRASRTATSFALT